MTSSINFDFAKQQNNDAIKSSKALQHDFAAAEAGM